MTDAPSLRLTVDGESRTVDQGTTAAELYSEQRHVVVAHVNGELKDLAIELRDGTPWSAC